MSLATACAGSDAPDVEADAVHVRPQAMTADDETPFNPVIVTSGTCLSKGFLPIDTPDACSRADAIVFADERPAPANLPARPSGVGCSIGTADDDSTSLEAIFDEGSAESYEEQQCSHNRPCVCYDPGDAPGLTACRDGIFRPDPKKYYTIRSANGRYMRSIDRKNAEPALVFHDPVVLSPLAEDALQPYTQPRPAFDFTDLETVRTPTDIRFHWRFEAPNADDSSYSPINRLTGKRLTTGRPEGLEQTLQMDPSPTTPPLAFTCRGSQVFFEQDGFAPVDAMGLLRDSNDTTRISLPLVYAEPQSPGRMVRQTNCMKKSRSCTSKYGAGFVQTDRELCGFFHQLHQLTCENRLNAPVSMYVPQGWYIEELTEFSRAVDFDPAPVTVDPLRSPTAVGNSLATLGNSAGSTIGGAVVAIGTDLLLENSGPLFGAMFSFGLGFLPGGAFDPNSPDPLELFAEAITDALEQLAADLTDQTEELIGNGLAQESARELNARMNARRRAFYTEFPERRNVLLALDQPSQTLRLADELFDDADELDVDIDAAFPSLSVSPSELDLRRAHFGLDVAKLATVEAMIMLSEGALLEALATPELSCSQIVASQALQSRADFYTDKIEAGVDALVDHGKLSRDNRANDTEEEFEFDARNFSYDVQPHVAFIDNMVKETLRKCRLLRDPSSPFRQHFIDNTPMPVECHGDPGSGDSDESGTCNDVVAALATPWTEIATFGSNSGVAEPAVADIDGDGDLDVVTRHHNQRRLVSWTNTGGTLGEGGSLSLSSKPFGFALSDFDGDGDLDLATAGGSSNRLIVADNVGTGFGGLQFLAVDSGFRSVLAMSVDDDERPDLIAYDSSSQEIRVYRNISAPSDIAFEPPTVIDSVSSSAFAGPGLAALDFDDDGDQDLVVAGSQLALYENEGGTLAGPVVIDTVNLGSAIFAVDLDGDYDADILGRVGNRAVWYENRGVGGFAAAQDVPGNVSAGAIAVGDLDGDGDTDIVVRHRDTGELFWVQNGNQGLVARPPIGIAPDAIVVGDVDGDGDADVVAANPAQNGLITFLSPLL